MAWCSGFMSSGGVVEVGRVVVVCDFEARRRVRMAWEVRDERMLEVWIER
jgi:hypothetical protein